MQFAHLKRTRNLDQGRTEYTCTQEFTYITYTDKHVCIHVFINILRHTSCLWNTIILTKADFPENLRKVTKMCRLCVCVLINKRSFEPFMCLDLVLERSQSFLFQIFFSVRNVFLNVFLFPQIFSTDYRSHANGTALIISYQPSVMNA